jgi:hypothetical protein
MSGPKVVRIVTREEIIAICEGHLARLNAAVEEWLKVGRRNDLLTEVEIAATRARQAGLRRLLQEDRFTELQKAVPDEIHFLAADQETRLARAAVEKAKTRSAQRQTEAAAVAVLKALERKGVSVPDDLRSALQDTAAGRADGAATISEAFALLSAPEKTSAVSDHQRRLAEKHKDSDDRQTFKQWLAANSPGGDNAELTRLDLRLAELASFWRRRPPRNSRLDCAAYSPLSRRPIVRCWLTAWNWTSFKPSPGPGKEPLFSYA